MTIINDWYQLHNSIKSLYNVTKYRENSDKCTKDLKWKITLNYGEKNLFFCENCKKDGLYALDNSLDYWQKSELIRDW